MAKFEDIIKGVDALVQWHEQGQLSDAHKEKIRDNIKKLTEVDGNSHIILFLQKKLPDVIDLNSVSAYIIKDNPLMASEVARLSGNEWVLTDAYMAQATTPESAVKWAQKFYTGSEAFPPVVQNRIADSWSRFMSRFYSQASIGIKGTQPTFTDEAAESFATALHWATPESMRIAMPEPRDNLIIAAQYYMRTQALNEVLPEVAGLRNNLLVMVWTACMEDPDNCHKQRQAEVLTLQNLRFVYKAEDWVKANVSADKAKNVLEMWHKNSDEIDLYLNPGQFSKEAGMDVAMEIDASIKTMNQSTYQMSLSL